VRQVAVCGPAECSGPEAAWAFEVGALLAGRAAVVLCGGGAGVMAAAMDGARTAGGLAVAIRPDHGDTGAAVTIRTGMGQARNAILVASADAVIAVGGSWGTLSEVALARRAGLPVVSLGGWRVLDAAGAEVPGVLVAADPGEAVAAALAAAGSAEVSGA
jgi:uncharacterized protein (TIGR00725 family)